jgi:hypothetical protein
MIVTPLLWLLVLPLVASALIYLAGRAADLHAAG